jgi:hypothetical protein
VQAQFFKSSVVYNLMRWQDKKRLMRRAASQHVFRLLQYAGKGLQFGKVFHSLLI